MQKLFNFTIVRTYFIFQVLTRLVLSIYAGTNKQIGWQELPGIFALGFLNDLVSVCYFLPPLLILIVLFHKILAKYPRLEQSMAIFAYLLTLLILMFNSISELVFWDEFGTKFNFIAVDYLIYTNEIIGTLKESMYLAELIAGLLIATLLLAFLLSKYVMRQIEKINVKSHIIYAIILCVLGIWSFNFYDDKKATLSLNKYAQELGRNGPYEFFSAYNNNVLDYNQLYPTIDPARALEVVRANIEQGKWQPKASDGIERQIVAASPMVNPPKYNVILITVESLSAEFMEQFGNQGNITPNLDRLVPQSLFFTNLYAVGTRTVRGLEAITLSAPPTPGSSIIRRPKNQNLFNIGSIFTTYGYDINFVFGGYSYFDNLENYFAGNGYTILDRSHLKSSEISFANIWGVADEDILLKSLEIGDRNYAAGRPFFSLIMTTSNHRPYTFPEGRIDLPSGGGRAAAVKYTDYAIGKFLGQARLKPWFDNTIFVITADHCASSAGKTDLPIHKYHIPLLIYAPKILKPQRITNLASQIDIAPTIFGLLNFAYKSKFFGHDIINAPANRAFISTYQLLGLMKDNNLIILGPNAAPRSYKLTGEEKELIDPQPALIEEAISFYQTAYDFYIQDKMLKFKN